MRINVTFYRRDGFIWVNVRYNTLRFRQSIGIPIEPKHWGKGKVKNTHLEATVFNNLLDRLKVKIQTELLKNENTDTKEVLMSCLGKAKKNKVTLSSYIDSVIEAREKRGDTAHALSGYRVARIQFLAFCKAQKKTYDFDTFTIEAISEFIAFLSNQNNANGEKYAQNSIQKIVARLKYMMKEAYESGYHKNDVFRFKKFGVNKVESDSIYLTNDELKKLSELQLTGTLDKVRDVFLIACYTGLRFSDFSVLNKTNITEGVSKQGRTFNAFKIRTKKTGKLVEIPFSPEVIQILEKYNGIPPKSFSNVKMNLYLKEIAEKAGLNDNVEKTETRGGQKIVTTEKKFTLVTCHTARRTFATNAVLSGMPIYLIMSLTSHTTESSFKKYVKFNSLDASRIAADEEFFN